ERKDAEMFAGVAAPVEEVPELGSLVLRVPLTEAVTVGEEALLGAGLFLVAAGATHCRVDLQLGDGVEERHRLERVAARVRPRLLDDAAAVDRVLDVADEKVRVE